MTARYEKALEGGNHQGLGIVTTTQLRTRYEYYTIR